MDAPTRIAAKLSPSQLGTKVRHYAGTPPELTDGQETRRELQPASVLLIEPSESGVLLIRYAAGGKFAGDTWHPTVDEAKEQAAFEFGTLDLAWKEVPTAVNDIVAFVISS
jgi:hypothetical protein